MLYTTYNKHFVSKKGTTMLLLLLLENDMTMYANKMYIV